MELIGGQIIILRIFVETIKGHGTISHNGSQTAVDYVVKVIFTQRCRWF
jgi:hypothetical protein